MRLRQDAQRKRRITEVAGQWADGLDRAVHRRRIGEYPSIRKHAGVLPFRVDTSERRANRSEAGAVGGPTHRATKIRTESEHAHSGSNRRGLAATRSAGGPDDAVRSHRTGRGSEQFVASQAARAEFRGVGLADQNCAGSLERRNGRCIDGRDVVRQSSRTGGGTHAGSSDQVLDRERNPGKGAECLTEKASFVQGIRGRANLLGAHGDQCVEFVIAFVDPCEVVFDDGPRRRLTRPHGFGDGSGITAHPTLTTHRTPLLASTLCRA